MLKKHVKKIGVLLISLSLLISTSYAASLKKTIDVYYDNIKIFVNNSLVNPKDGNGKPVEPFIYDGTTYLPVRAVAEALDKEVTWDGTTKSVHISDKKVVDPSIVWLNDLEYFNLQSSISVNRWSKLENDSFKDATGNFCSRAIQCTMCSEWLYTDYLINKKYSRITGKFALSFDSRSTTYIATLNLYGDNKLLYTSPRLTGGVLPIDFDVDISGVEKLRIEISTNIPFLGSSANYGLIDVALHK